MEIRLLSMGRNINEVIIIDIYIAKPPHQRHRLFMYSSLIFWNIHGSKFYCYLLTTGVIDNDKASDMINGIKIYSILFRSFYSILIKFYIRIINKSIIMNTLIKIERPIKSP